MGMKDFIRTECREVTRHDPLEQRAMESLSLSCPARVLKLVASRTV